MKQDWHGASITSGSGSENGRGGDVGSHNTVTNSNNSTSSINFYGPQFILSPDGKALDLSWFNQLVTHPFHGDANQQWTLVEDGTGKVALKSEYNGSFAGVGSQQSAGLVGVKNPFYWNVAQDKGGYQFVAPDTGLALGLGSSANLCPPTDESTKVYVLEDTPENREAIYKGGVVQAAQMVTPGVSTRSGSDGRGGDVGSDNSGANSGMNQDFKSSTISTGGGSGGGRGGDVGSGNSSANSRMNQDFKASTISTGSGSDDGRGGDVGSGNSGANSGINQDFKSSTIPTGDGSDGGRGGDVGSGNSGANSGMNQDLKASTISTGNGSSDGRVGDVGSGNSNACSGMNQVLLEEAQKSQEARCEQLEERYQGNSPSPDIAFSITTPTCLRLSNNSPWNTDLTNLDGKILYRVATPPCRGSRTTIVSRVTGNFATEVAKIIWHRSGVEAFRFQGKEIDYYSYFRTDGFLSQDIS